MRSALLALAAVALAACATTPREEPGITVREVEYRAGDVILKGHLALPAPSATPRPAVLVVHEWWGRGAHADHSAEELARMGYIGLALDMYGDGRSTKDPNQAGAWAGEIRNAPQMGIARLRAAIDVVRALPEADASRMACIGYCFGGTTSLEAAWAGIDLDAVVSFHGSLTTPKPEQTAGVKASILVLHGADDPLVPQEQITAFEESMRANKFDWELVAYGGAVHSFTNPEADGSFNAGVKYHAVAASRSWERMRDFLAERLR